MPQRIQRRRTKGWRKPEGAVYVGRGSQWGNPWRAVSGSVVGPSWHQFRMLAMSATVHTVPLRDCASYSTHAPSDRALQVAVDTFRDYCRVMHRDHPHEFAAWIHGLRGKDLMCWCPLDQPCHADVLLEVANSEEDDQ